MFLTFFPGIWGPEVSILRELDEVYMEKSIKTKGGQYILVYEN